MNKDVLGYVKALATALLLAGAATTAFEVYPWNTIFYFLGAIGWGIVAYEWKDKSLMAINAVSAMVFVIGWMR